jgi:hypothetical protein
MEYSKILEDLEKDIVYYDETTVKLLERKKLEESRKKRDKKWEEVYQIIDEYRQRRKESSDKYYQERDSIVQGINECHQKIKESFNKYNETFDSTVQGINKRFDDFEKKLINL